MRIALISDSHTKNNIERITEYLRAKAEPWKIDIIIVNGDVLGENEAREGYGFNYNKKLFEASINREERLMELVPEIAQGLLKASLSSDELEFSRLIKSYIEKRYDFLLTKLVDLSKLRKTFFNPGTYESPLTFQTINELAFLLDTDEARLRRIALLTDYRDVFKDFLAKAKAHKNLEYIGGSSVLFGDLLMVGIPGLHKSSGPGDSMSEFQEKLTAELLNSVSRKMSYATKLLILNQTQGKLRKPFHYRPASLSVRRFIESAKGKMRQKIFVQSYHHWVTTHFYQAAEFFFILNNAAVNNSLFNIIEISAKVGCLDADPNLDRIRRLNPYNYNIADASTPKARLGLNYIEPDEIIKERNIAGCYYM